MPKSKRSKYSAKFKLQVVKFAQNSNNSAAGREFDVNEKQVRDWRHDMTSRDSKNWLQFSQQTAPLGATKS